MEAEDQTLSSEEAPRRERRSKKKGTKSRRRQDTQQQQQQGGGSSGPLDQLPLAGDLGNTVGGVTDGVSNTLGGVTGGLGGLTGGQQQQGGGGGDAGKDTLRLRLDLNLDIEIQLKARIHGDLELSLLYVTCSPCRYSRNYYLWPSYLTWLANLQHGIKRCLCFCLQEANRFGAVQKLEHFRYCYCSCSCDCNRDCNRCHLSSSCHDGTHVMLLLVQQFEQQQQRRNMVFINDGYFLVLFLLYNFTVVFWERDKYYYITTFSYINLGKKSISLQSWTVDVICL
jgi:hypothetical protein